MLLAYDSKVYATQLCIVVKKEKLMKTSKIAKIIYKIYWYIKKKSNQRKNYININIKFYKDYAGSFLSKW